ncbi:MAG: hypothetical protein QW548_02395 [Candidatus Aenigmatarchaeota archaeon]
MEYDSNVSPSAATAVLPAIDVRTCKGCDRRYITRGDGEDVLSSKYCRTCIETMKRTPVPPYDKELRRRGMRI